MFVKVMEKYFDKEDNMELRFKGQILDIADEDRAKTLIRYGLVKECKVIKVGYKTEDVTLNEIKDETVDVGSLKIKDIKALLDKEGIEYKANATKDELLELLPF